MRLKKFLILTMVLLSAAAINAQDKRCNLEIRAFESEDFVSLVGAKVLVRNLSSKAVLDSGEQFDKYVFPNMPAGNYEVIVSRENYKQTISKTRLTCDNLTPQDYVVFGVTLWQGDSNERVVVEEKNEGTLKAIGMSDSKEERLKKYAKANNILNYDATALAKPKYPAAAKVVRAGGVVYVRVSINEQGEVVAASAVSGHPLLRAEAVKAARESKFKPSPVAGKANLTGFVIYNFVP